VQVRTEAVVGGAWRNIDIGDDGTITLPPGCGVDLGGFARLDGGQRRELMAPCETWPSTPGRSFADGGGPMAAAG
jgi:hypothetical protein